LDRDAGNLASRLATAESHIINETKSWLKEEGIDIDEIEKMNRSKCPRDNRTILVKNLDHDANHNNLQELFGRFGVIEKLLVSPSNTLALITYDNEGQAHAALSKLSYTKPRWNAPPLFLEFAPKLLLKESVRRSRRLS
jgi:multiple RNA-binding domain-containing protein 1